MLSLGNHSNPTRFGIFCNREYTKHLAFYPKDSPSLVSINHKGHFRGMGQQLTRQIVRLWGQQLSHPAQQIRHLIWGLRWTVRRKRMLRMLMNHKNIHGPCVGKTLCEGKLKEWATIQKHQHRLDGMHPRPFNVIDFWPNWRSVVMHTSALRWSH